MKLLLMLTWSLTLKYPPWIFNQCKTTRTNRSTRTSLRIKRWALVTWLLTTTKRTKSKSRVLLHLEEVPGLHHQLQVIWLPSTLIISLIKWRHPWLRRSSAETVRKERNPARRLRGCLTRSTWELKAICSKISAILVWTLRVTKRIKTI